MPPIRDDEVKFVADDPTTYVFLAYSLVRLKATQPTLFQGFVEAFDSVLKHHALNLIDMPPHDVMSIYCQGRTKTLNVLSKVIDDCSKIVKTYETNKEAKDGTRAQLAARVAGN